MRRRRVRRRRRGRRSCCSTVRRCVPAAAGSARSRAPARRRRRRSSRAAPRRRDRARRCAARRPRCACAASCRSATGRQRQAAVEEVAEHAAARAPSTARSPRRRRAAGGPAGRAAPVTAANSGASSARRSRSPMIAWCSACVPVGQRQPGRAEDVADGRGRRSTAGPSACIGVDVGLAAVPAARASRRARRTIASSTIAPSRRATAEPSSPAAATAVLHRGRPGALGGARGEAVVDRADLLGVDRPLAVVAELARIARTASCRPAGVAEPEVRPVDRLDRRRCAPRPAAVSWRDEPARGVGLGPAAAERGGEVGVAEDQRERRRRLRRSRARPAARPASRSAPGRRARQRVADGGDRWRHPRPSGTTTESPSRLSAAQAAASAWNCGVSTALTRTATRRSPALGGSVAATWRRASSLASGATASSRSKTTSSAALASALACIRAAWPGTTRQDLRTQRPYTALTTFPSSFERQGA